MVKPKITILGAGVSGQAAAALCQQQGLQFSLIANDREALPPDFDRTELFVVSPGLPPVSPLYRTAVASGAEMISELEFASRYAQGKILAVTGTNGKTTTTELVVYILRNAGFDARPAGNIGTALSEAVITATPETILVVEVSSFQLELCNTFQPIAGVILNLSSDHLERYAGSMEQYLQTKLRLFANIARPQNRLVGAQLARHKYFPKHLECKIVPPLPLDTIELPSGLTAPHNRANLAAAIALVHAIVDENRLPVRQIMRLVNNFTSGKHRLELFLEHNGIRYIDDSKATNPAAVIAAVEALSTHYNGRIRLILGGLDKGMNFAELMPIVHRLRKAYIYGASRETIAEALPSELESALFSDFDAAVDTACREACRGDTVLLSPACASMDQFRNYRHRGEHFQSLIKELAPTLSSATQP